jgi:hypothetical protein
MRLIARLLIAHLATRVSDHQHQGQAADEVIKAQDRHLKEMVAGGETAHAPALKEMKGRWKHPI